MPPFPPVMMKVFPLIFSVFFAFFPSGLVLYWTTNQVLMMTQQVLYHRKREAREKAGTG